MSVAVSFVTMAACSAVPADSEQRTAPAPSVVATGPAPAVEVVPEPTATTHVGGPTEAPTPVPPRVRLEAAKALLARDGLDLTQCPGTPDPVRCTLEAAYRDAPDTSALALAIYDETGSVTGVEPGRVMDGGWRGEITLVPERPLGRHLRHLRWIAKSLRDFTWFFGALKDDGSSDVDYRFAPLELAFFRSVGRTTPSAYARNWRVAYNVNGSLHRSERAVRETMFHEIFHLNDAERGRWSDTHLQPVFDRIVARCTRNGRLSTPCLRPYAPGTTMVRGGTFYAFQPGNGVGEYAAELALRYYREHRQWLKSARLSAKPFKCGPPDNAEAWNAMVRTFFGGIDRLNCHAP